MRLSRLRLVYMSRPTCSCFTSFQFLSWFMHCCSYTYSRATRMPPHAHANCTSNGRPRTCCPARAGYEKTIIIPCMKRSLLCQHYTILIPGILLRLLPRLLYTEDGEVTVESRSRAARGALWRVVILRTLTARPVIATTVFRLLIRAVQGLVYDGRIILLV